MGLLSKAAILVLGYSIYKIATDEDYEPLKLLIKEAYNTAKPIMINLIEDYEFGRTNTNHINMNRNEIDVDTQIVMIKDAIEKINAEQLAISITNSAKKLQEKAKNNIKK